MQDPMGILQVLDLSASLSYRARRAVEAKLRDKALTYAQFEALSALADRDGLSQAELAIDLETDSTTAMVLRGSLEKKGLVTRAPDPIDGRVMRISLTASGSSLFKEVKPLVEKLFEQAEELFSEPEIKRLIPLLERLREFAGAAMPQPPRKGEGRPRGRPRKERPAVDASAEPKRRGRPRKPAEALGLAEKAAAEKPLAKKRGKSAVEPKAQAEKTAKTGGAKKASTASGKSASKTAAKPSAGGAKKRASKPKAS